MTNRRAFSVVELLTALVLLTVGLAAYVRAAGALARLEGDARLRHRVAAAIIARLDSLQGRSCGAALSGVAQGDGIRERWTVATANGQFAFRDTIEVPARPALARGLQATIGCEP
ncbi:MAG TPA: hypothetical protein VGJ96_13365 [Gemmatimonadaceae bacterium]|jgi:Tfp pilus assembly protein PilV